MSQEFGPENMPHDESQSEELEEVIDIEKDPFAYNKEFDLTTIEGYRQLQQMRPVDIEEKDWNFKLEGVKLMVERALSEGSTDTEIRKILEDFLERNNLR